MSSKTAVPPSTLVTVKITYNDNTRRFKLALKDLGASVLPDKLGGLLGIPSDNEVLFERYSDSSSSWVVLDVANHSVYKQLYRAAKAKLKLRIRATVIPKANEQAVSAESTTAPADAPVDTPVGAPVDAPASRARKPFIDEGFAASTGTLIPVNTEHLDEVVAQAVNTYCTSDQFTSQLRDTVREEVEKRAPETNASMQDLISLQRSYTSASDDTLLAARTNSMTLEPQPAELESKLSTIEVYCNACHETITGYHYHCGKCDDGDFDLCRSCTATGAHCHDTRHWLARRNTEDADKPEKPEKFIKRVPTRICNNCVKEFNQYEFVHCKDCRDFDLCLWCHREQKHGHDPRHTFVTVDFNTELSSTDKERMAAGRGVVHSAFCDNCDKRITGIRYKCIDCPNWDNCGYCYPLSGTTHPRHRFAPVFDNHTVTPLHQMGNLAMVKHYGIYCDGPICEKGPQECIRGPRYKCAVCPDTDFCATCEASPANTHNVTHPLIKIKSPIRNVICQTIDDNNNEIVMGDRELAVPVFTKSTAAATSNAATQVQTVVDVKPTEEFAEPAPAPKSSEVTEAHPPPKATLCATFLEDTVPDGTIIGVGQEFTQSWTLRNTGNTTWPAGVTCTFTGGDYMFAKRDESCFNMTDTQSEVKPGQVYSFTVHLSAPLPGNKNCISYWRLTSPDGTRFGDNLWCSIYVAEEPSNRKGEELESNINDVLHSGVSVADTESIHGSDDVALVEKTEQKELLLSHGRDGADQGELPTPQMVAEAREWIQSNLSQQESIEEASESGTNGSEHKTSKKSSVQSEETSQMIFPKLPVESPVHSVESLHSSSEAFTAHERPDSISPINSHRAPSSADVFSDIDVSSIGDDESFMTDEEYDVLDASDEEFENVA